MEPQGSADSNAAVATEQAAAAPAEGALQAPGEGPVIDARRIGNGRRSGPKLSISGAQVKRAATQGAEAVRDASTAGRDSAAPEFDLRGVPKRERRRIDVDNPFH